MKKSNIFLFILSFALLLGFTACSDDDDDDDNPAGPSGSDDIQIDATSHENWSYFDFASGETVEITDASTSSDWHIAFQRYNVKLNGGSSGPLSIQVADLEELGNDFGMDYDGLETLPELSAEDFGTDEVNYIFQDWYTYDMSNHSVNPSGKVFAFRDAEGNYAKLEITSITAAGFAIGTAELTYVYDSMGGGDLSGTPTVATITDEDEDGVLYFSFSDGQVDIADPSSSMDWDICFDGFDATINGGVSGPGQTGIYPIYDDNPNVTFDDLTTAPVDMGGSYETDSASSPLVNWYDYNGQTHEIMSKDHVYIIKVDDTTHYKFTITNYYKVVEGSPAAGWISILYDEL